MTEELQLAKLFVSALQNEAPVLVNIRSPLQTMHRKLIAWQLQLEINTELTGV